MIIKFEKFILFLLPRLNIKRYNVKIYKIVVGLSVEMDSHAQFKRGGGGGGIEGMTLIP